MLPIQLSAYGRLGKSRALVTSPEALAGTINEVKDDPEHRHLLLLASSEIEYLDFHVQSTSSLMVFRVAKQERRRKQLFVSGTSTYNGVRLDEWAATRHSRKVLLGRGVHVEVDLAGSHRWDSAASVLSSAQRDEIRAHLQRMHNTRMSGNWWREWKGTVAAILGIVVTGAKLTFGMKAAVGGIFVNWSFAGHVFQAGAFGAKASAVATAAGPAVLLGAGVAAAVYFVPWESLFQWLRGALSRIWDWICDLWEGIQKLLSKNRSRHRYGARPL